MASTRETWSVKDGGVLHTMGYAPTYFPGTALSTEARRVTVTLGGEVSNTDFALSIGRAAIVSGTAVDSQGRPFGDVSLTAVAGRDGDHPEVAILPLRVDGQM